MLEESPKSGSEIIKKLNEDFNWAPSCGSIYPLLNSLEKEGLTVSRKDDGKKIYSLTKEAHSVIKKSELEKDELFSALEKSYKLLESVYGIDTSLEQDMLKDMKRGKVPFQELYLETKAIKEELERLQRANKLKKNLVEVKKILKDAGEKLKKIK